MIKNASSGSCTEARSANFHYPLVTARKSLSSVLATSSRISSRPCPLSQVRAVRHILAITGKLAEKEVQVFAQRRLIAFGDEQEVASPVRDLGTEGMLGVQGIR